MIRCFMEKTEKLDENWLIKQGHPPFQDTSIDIANKMDSMLIVIHYYHQPTEALNTVHYTTMADDHDKYDNPGTNENDNP